MPFDPKGYVKVANDLGTAYTDEANLRVAVGRIYYGVFLLLRSEVNVAVGSQGQHKAVKDRIARKNLAIGSKYGSLYDLRIEADYYCDNPKDPANGDWSINWSQASSYATEILTFFNKLT